MLNRITIFAAAVILAAPVCAATGGASSAGGNSTGGSAGGHSEGGGGSGGGSSGGAGHGSGANGSGGLSGRAAAATMHSAVNGLDPSLHAGISHADAMHATHFAGDKHSEGEHAASNSTGMHHHHHPYREEPGYGVARDQSYFSTCIPAADTSTRSWFDCNRPTKSIPGHKS
jgi:hypothetical protein